MTKNPKFAYAGILLSALVFTATACGGGGGAGSAAGTSGATERALGSTTQAPGGTEADSGMITLALKYVAYDNSSGVPIIDAAGVNRAVARINDLFAQCRIRFSLEQYQEVNPSQYGLDYNLASMGDLDTVRTKFADDTKMLVVNTGAWDSGGISANAWTAMPGSGVYGAVLDGTIAYDFEIAAHELGHYLNLDHVDNQANLMNPVIYKTSTELSEGQCAAARQAAADFWVKLLR